MTRRVPRYRDFADPASENLVEQIEAQGARLSARLDRVRKIVVVASGKGGVGKSAVTANVAAVLAGDGLAVGVADADLYGPSLAAMLGADGGELVVTDDGVEPARGAAGTRVVSMDHLLADGAPLEWRRSGAGGFAVQSTLDTSAVRELLSDVIWGDLDLLLIDAPPGTDKLARLIDLLPRIDVLLLVTTPSEAACRAVGRAARLAAEAEIGETSLVANMTAFPCPCCGEPVHLYEQDGAERLAGETGLEVWARIPFDPALAEVTDSGRPSTATDASSPATDALRALGRRLARKVEDER